jgi:hypothetical protein
MVVQRTLNKVEELKERPHHERRAIAYYGAIGIAGLILIIWGFFALNRFGDNAQSLTDAGVLDSGNPQAAAAASIIVQEEPAPGTLTASSSNGRVDLVPAR